MSNGRSPDPWFRCIPIWRITFAFRGNEIRAVSRRRVQMTLPPSAPLEADADQRGFSWWLEDASGKRIYRQVMPRPQRDYLEVFSERTGPAIRRVRASHEASGSFTLFVPDLEEGGRLMLLDDCPTPPRPPGPRGQPLPILLGEIPEIILPEDLRLFGEDVGVTKIVDHGSPCERWNLLILSEGYVAEDLSKFKVDVTAFVNTLRTTPPFDRLWCGINIYRVDVASTESGADDPTPCGGSGAAPSTFFDASFCTDNLQRLMAVDTTLVKEVADFALPQWHQALVMVNSLIYGGAGYPGDRIAVFSLGKSNAGADAAQIAIHEMGHSIANLADEYDHLSSCDDPDAAHWTSGEPVEANITTNLDRATMKWSAFIQGTTELPTSANPDCSKCDSQPTPVPAGTVGAFEGAVFFHCGIYRPEYDCKMRHHAQDFCAVCQHALRVALSPYLPAPVFVRVELSSSTGPVPASLGGRGTAAYLGVEYEISWCAGATLVVTAMTRGPFELVSPRRISVAPARHPHSERGSFWFSCTSGVPGESASATATIECVETQESWTVSLSTTTVARPRPAVSLVLACSGRDAVGAAGLRRAAAAFVTMLPDGVGLSLVIADREGSRASPMQAIDDRTRAEALRILATGEIDGSAGRGADAAAFDARATVLLTDGGPTTDLAHAVDERVFALVLEPPEGSGAGDLERLTEGRRGYALRASLPVPDDLSLECRALQIAAAISDSGAAVRTSGRIGPGAEQRLPFTVAAADQALDLVLAVRGSGDLELSLETPAGQPVDDAQVTVQRDTPLPDGRHLLCARLVLPNPPVGKPDPLNGVWHAHVRAGKQARADADYELAVYAHSTLQLDARVAELAAGRIAVSARLSEYGQPPSREARVWLEVTDPEVAELTVPLDEVAPGRFEGEWSAIPTGLWQIRVRARGTTAEGIPFERETTRTAWRIAPAAP